MYQKRTAAIELHAGGTSTIWLALLRTTTCIPSARNSFCRCVAAICRSSSTSISALKTAPSSGVSSRMLSWPANAASTRCRDTLSCLLAS